MEPEQHPDCIINVVTGRVATALVNVDKSIEIGNKQMKEYEKKWPTGFYDTIIKKQVETIAVTKTCIEVGENKI